MTLQLLVIVFIFINVLTESNTYKHLGCWTEDLTSPDLSGKTSSFTKLSECLSWCFGESFSYGAMYNGEKCLCGYTYGKFGTSSSCTESSSCGGKCGGASSSDVYYSLPEVTSRPFRFVLNKVNFADARKYCIRNHRGDLSSASTESRWSSLKAIVDSVKSSGKTSGKLWVGVWKPLSTFQWVDAYKTATVDSKKWANSQPLAINKCAIIRIADYLLESVSCTDGTIDGFICEETPSTATTKNPASTTSENSQSKDSTWFTTRNVTFFIVMPLFGLCYGGSCCVYGIHRICRALKRKQKDKSKELLSNEQSLSNDSVVRFSAFNRDRRPPSGGSGDNRQDLNELKPIEIIYNPPNRPSSQAKSSSIQVTALMEIPPKNLTKVDNNNDDLDIDQKPQELDKSELSNEEGEMERKQPEGKQDSPQFEKSISRNSVLVEPLSDKNQTKNEKDDEEAPAEEEKKDDVKRSALLRRALRDARKRRRDGATSSMDSRRIDTPQARPKTTMGRRRSPLPPLCNNKTAPADDGDDEDDFVNKRPPPRTFLATAKSGFRTPVDPRLVQNQSRQEIDDVEDTGEAQILYVEPREDPPNRISIDDILKSKNAKNNNNKKKRILAA
ncbi:DgyrCDS6562 [Dimorphilus gyrociliatus]|uniref:DgyrCDS6562 n=1 Tax=Dimorphilus gyrociliatus TaxID=2664684 RepID=A0A7I8VR55_9ANNE|nr:DgyrCDS6562 [Dimorphilus gyrociliatus]